MEFHNLMTPISLMSTMWELLIPVLSQELDLKNHPLHLHKVDIMMLTDHLTDLDHHIMITDHLSGIDHHIMITTKDLHHVHGTTISSHPPTMLEHPLGVMIPIGLRKETKGLVRDAFSVMVMIMTQMIAAD